MRGSIGNCLKRVEEPEVTLMEPWRLDCRRFGLSEFDFERPRSRDALILVIIAAGFFIWSYLTGRRGGLA